VRADLTGAKMLVVSVQPRPVCVCVGGVSCHLRCCSYSHVRTTSARRCSSLPTLSTVLRPNKRLHLNSSWMLYGKKKNVIIIYQTLVILSTL